jgi:hypothetical protein
MQDHKFNQPNISNTIIIQIHSTQKRKERKKVRCTMGNDL